MVRFREGRRDPTTLRTDPLGLEQVAIDNGGSPESSQSRRRNHLLDDLGFVIDHQV